MKSEQNDPKDYDAEVPGTEDYLEPNGYSPDDPSPSSDQRKVVLGKTLNKKFVLRLLISTAALLAVVGLGSGSGFGVYAPGPNFPLQPIGTSVTDEVTGTWLATTVEMREISVAKLVLARVNGDPVVPMPEESMAWGARQDMTSSLSNALAAATATLGGFKAEVALVIGNVKDDSLGFELGFRSGEYIHTIDGRSVTDLEEASRTLNHLDRSVRIEIGEPSRLIVVPPRTGPLGVQILTMPTNKLPDLKVALPGVGGPSAGLMIALAEIDAMTDGDLTGGRLVAGTGVIQIDGLVRPVNGVTAKLQAAEAAGVGLFFAPPGQAKTEVGNMSVVPVASVREAIEYLCSNGSPAACPIIGR